MPAFSALQLTLSDTRHALITVAPSIATTPAGLAFDAIHAEWEGKLPQEADALFSWLLAQPQDDLLALLAFCTASSLDTVTTPNMVPVGEARAHVLMDALVLDMADWWTPTRASYFDHVPKAKVLGVVAEAVFDAGRRQACQTQEGVAGRSCRASCCEYPLAAYPTAPVTRRAGRTLPARPYNSLRELGAHVRRPVGLPGRATLDALPFPTAATHWLDSIENT